MTSHRMRYRIVAGVVAGAVVLAIPTAAMAATPSTSPAKSSQGVLNPATKDPATFKAAKTFVEHQLAWRQHRLTNLTAEVRKASDLTYSDRATLRSDLSGETAGINALAAKVPNDTTWAELQADAKAMIVDYRVFVVMSPQVHLTITADTASTVEGKLAAAEPQIEALIQYEQSQGKKVGAAQTAYDSLVVQVSNAQNDTNGVSAAVLATSPAGYPGNKTIFVNARSSLEQARKALVTARGDLHTIANVLGV